MTSNFKKCLELIQPPNDQFPVFHFLEMPEVPFGSSFFLKVIAAASPVSRLFLSSLFAFRCAFEAEDEELSCCHV